MGIFRKKDVSRDRTGMRRHLRLLDLILLGIGAMVGTGIFTITGTAAATLAGPAFGDFDYYFCSLREYFCFLLCRICVKNSCKWRCL